MEDDSGCEHDEQIVPGRPPGYRSRCGWPAVLQGCGTTYVHPISESSQDGLAHCMKCGKRTVMNCIPDEQQPAWAAAVIRESGVGVQTWCQLRDAWTGLKPGGPTDAALGDGRERERARTQPPESDSEDEEVIDWLEDAVAGSRLHAPQSLGGRVNLGRVVRALSYLWEDGA
eukprot:TRINITY_DN35495_c0_g1_i1.p2 TRINITY_DN35495_c0_g1~~TRINITY_DN35495_c0_g1_i1.p2  ORF type:complete len:172 (+),score=38.88 TRINITY_DN35495_c0_g1_i1:194-709(+)